MISNVSADQGAFFQAELSPTFLSSFAGGDAKFGALGYGFRGGYAWPLLDIFAQVEHDFWFNSDVGDNRANSVFNFGVGAGITYFDGHIRTALAVGTSTMLFQSIHYTPGGTGFFLDFRPAAIRFRVKKHITIEFHPLAFGFCVPTFENLPIVNISYRSIIAVERSF